MQSDYECSLARVLATSTGSLLVDNCIRAWVLVTLAGSLFIGPGTKA